MMREKERERKGSHTTRNQEVNPFLSLSRHLLLLLISFVHPLKRLSPCVVSQRCVSAACVAVRPASDTCIMFQSLFLFLFFLLQIKDR